MNLKEILMKALASFISSGVQVKSGPRIYYAAVKNLFKNKGCDNTMISDEAFNTLEPEEVRKFLKSSMVNYQKYVAETYDCDDFSYSLLGEASIVIPGGAFGLAWVDRPDGVKHSLNFFIDDNYQVWWVEPQTDLIFKDSRFKPYFVLI